MKKNIFWLTITVVIILSFSSAVFYQLKKTDWSNKKNQPITGNFNQKPPIKCKVSGCSSQLCVPEDSADQVTTCEFRAEYACYKLARCEVQTSGQCDWTATPEFQKCISSVEKQPPMVEILK